MLKHWRIVSIRHLKSGLLEALKALTLWRRPNLETAQVGPMLAKQNLQSFQNPKYERRLVQNIGIEFSHTAVECSFLFKFFVRIFRKQTFRNISKI